MSTVHQNADENQASEAPDFLSPEGGLILYRTIQPNSGCISANRPLLKAVNHASKQTVLFRPACKMWNCPHCGAKNAQKAVLTGLKGFKVFSDAGLKIDFVTVTSHEKLDAAASLAVLPLAWNKLNRRIKRAAQVAPEYFAIPEQHADGRWHLHALTTARLPKKWWKDNARACGLGYQSDVKEVTAAGGVAAYIAKYQGKMLQSTNIPKGFRRVRASKGWPDLPPLPQSENWAFFSVPRDVPMSHEVESYQAMGYAVILADENSSWDWLEMWA